MIDPKEKNSLSPEKEEQTSTIFSNSSVQVRKKSSPGKKKALKLLAAGLALLILAGTAAVLVITAPEPEPGSEVSSDETITFYEKERTNVKEVVVTHRGEESFTIYQKPAGGFTIESLKEFDAQTNRYTGLTNALAKLSARKLVTENPANLGDYGLADPATTLKVTFDDGSGYTLLIGNLSSTVSDGYFMKFADKDAVYISSTAIHTNACHPIEDYVSTTIIPAYDDGSGSENSDVSSVEYLNITLGGSKRKDPIVITPTPEEETENNILASVYKITSPKEAYVNSDILTKLTDNVFSLYATGIAYLHPTDAQLAECGLDNPTSTLSVKYKGGSHKILVGKTFGESCYVMREGVDLIYVAATSSFVWLDYQLEQLHTPFLYAMFISDLDRLKITKGDRVWDFKLNHDYYVDENDREQDDITVTESGKAVDVELFKDFYQVLITQRADELAGEVTQKEPVLELYLTPIDTKKDPIHVRFLVTGARTRGVEVNGVLTFQTTASYVDNLLENLDKLMRGEEIVIDS